MHLAAANGVLGRHGAAGGCCAPLRGAQQRQLQAACCYNIRWRAPAAPERGPISCYEPSRSCSAPCSAKNEPAAAPIAALHCEPMQPCFACVIASSMEPSNAAGRKCVGSAPGGLAASNVLGMCRVLCCANAKLGAQGIGPWSHGIRSSIAALAISVLCEVSHCKPSRLPTMAHARPFVGPSLTGPSRARRTLVINGAPCVGCVHLVPRTASLQPCSLQATHCASLPHNSQICSCPAERGASATAQGRQPAAQPGRQRSAGTERGPCYRR